MEENIRMVSSAKNDYAFKIILVIFTFVCVQSWVDIENFISNRNIVQSDKVLKQSGNDYIKELKDEGTTTGKGALSSK